MENLRNYVKEMIIRNKGDISDTLTYLDQHINALTLFIKSSSKKTESKLYQSEVQKTLKLKLLFQEELSIYKQGGSSMEQDIPFPLPPTKFGIQFFIDKIRILRIFLKKAYQNIKTNLPYLKKRNRILRKLPQQNLIFFSKEKTRDHYVHLADNFYKQFDTYSNKAISLDKEIEGKQYNNFTKPRVGGC